MHTVVTLYCLGKNNMGGKKSTQHTNMISSKSFQSVDMKVMDLRVN